MLQTCPACYSENRDVAKFCDQCGAALSPSGEMQEQQQVAVAVRPLSPINWTALLFLAAIVLAIVWVIRTPSTKEVAPPMAAATGAGADNPIGTMQNVQQQLADLKAKLKKDPLDSAALSELYSMYSQIGQAEKMQPYIDKAIAGWTKKLDRDPLDVESLSKLYSAYAMNSKPTDAQPYLDKALAAWSKKYPKPDEAARKVLAGIALAPLQVNDESGAAKALIIYHEADPTNRGVTGTVGDLYYEMNQPAEAIKWYDLYLDGATPAEQGEDYWNKTVDKATMYLNLAGTDAKSTDYAEALKLLLRATKEAPKHWAAWYNLGQAYKVAALKDKALAAFKQSLDVATKEDEKFQSQSEVNELEGKAPPTPPADPHAGMDMGSGMSLPKPPPGTPNPHAEGGGGM